MTTIAYRDGVLAADTCMSVGDSLHGRIVKIARNGTGDLAGGCGDAAYCRAFLRWFGAGEDGPPPEARSEQNGSDKAVIFRASGVVEVYEPRGMFEMGGPYFAMGSGRPEALGAMFAGADPETAVRAAIEHDAHTGGDVIVLRHADG